LFGLRFLVDWVFNVILHETIPMRSFSLRQILTVFSIVLVLSAGSLDAAWWKSKSDSAKTDKTEKASRDSTAEKTGKNKKKDSGSSVNDSDRFLSYDEQKEKELDDARAAKKGVFIRFPWSKKEKEVADPFGKVKSDAPKYQNLEELGISSEASRKETEQTALNAETSPRAGSALGETPVIPVGDSFSQNASSGTSDQFGLGTTAQPTDVLPNALPDSLPSSLPATGNGAVGSAVELPQTDSARNIPSQATQETSPSAVSPESREVSAALRNDTILKQLPSLTVDSSKLAGEGIQYYEHGQVLAQVGSQVILAGDIMQAVDKILEANKDKIPEQYWDMQREVLIRTFLQQSIEGKLVYCDVLRNVPAEGIKQNFELIDKLFEDQELPARMKKAGVELREDYEKILQEEGTCILKQKYMYREVVFCQQWMMKTLPQNPTVSYIEISDYYNEHPKEFETPPEASWEELVIRKNRFYTRDEAYQEIVRIGSMVAVQNKPFEEVAKEFSQGATATNGGKCEAVKPGQLASKTLEKAIFSQPVGELSAQVIEDEKSFYIIRVLERKEAVKHPLSEVQSKIQNQIKTSKINTAREEYLAKLRREIPVFTVFDGIPTPEERMKAEQEAAMAAQNRGGRMW